MYLIKLFHHDNFGREREIVLKYLPEKLFEEKRERIKKQSKLNILLECIKSMGRRKGKDTVFDFGKIIPYPEEYAKADDFAREWEERAKKDKTIDWSLRPQDGYNRGGYEWCIKNWGTKWNAAEPYIDDFEDKTKGVYIHFDTAWSPPIPIVDKLIELYPDLKFKLKYWEGGMGFKGVYSKTMNQCDNKYRGNRGG